MKIKFIAYIIFFIITIPFVITIIFHLTWWYFFLFIASVIVFITIYGCAKLMAEADMLNEKQDPDYYGINEKNDIEFYYPSRDIFSINNKSCSFVIDKKYRKINLLNNSFSLLDDNNTLIDCSSKKSLFFKYE